MAVITIAQKKSTIVDASRLTPPSSSLTTTMAPFLDLPMTARAIRPKIALQVFTPEIETMNSFAELSISSSEYRRYWSFERSCLTNMRAKTVAMEEEIPGSHATREPDTPPTKMPRKIRFLSSSSRERSCTGMTASDIRLMISCDEPKRPLSSGSRMEGSPKDMTGLTRYSILKANTPSIPLIKNIISA